MTNKITVEEYRDLIAKEKVRNRYGNTRCTWEGKWNGTQQKINFDSEKEMTRFCELLILERTGSIEDLELQPKFEMKPKTTKSRAINYFADFRYKENGKIIIEDVKSIATKKSRVYINKKKRLLDLLGDYQEFREVI